MNNSTSKLPFRVWLTERRCCCVDVLAGDAWAAKAYAEAHRDEWIDVVSESTIEQVLLYQRPDFRAVND